MSEYHSKITSRVVKLVGQPIFSETATTIRISDEGSGEFVIVEQFGNKCGLIKLDRYEWLHIKAAIDEMIERCEP